MLERIFRICHHSKRKKSFSYLKTKKVRTLSWVQLSVEHVFNMGKERGPGFHFKYQK